MKWVEDKWVFVKEFCENVYIYVLKKESNIVAAFYDYKRDRIWDDPYTYRSITNHSTNIKLISIKLSDQD